eukprot:TRINITY_DN102616_c0_g1_i1.p1 TRINITY_DN102616_c0_g1~~TRINITY_DN102616_c0_g1_i1.p1  ORF type:complete len:311 (-),score=36.83 TRINITY_DN102616_c0_g1_i1:27-929(-)
MLPRLLFFAVAGVHGLSPPSGCSVSQWTTPCAGTATCQSLTNAGLHCHTMTIPGCDAACASPCCVHTTTTSTKTLTSITTTHTTTTHTISITRSTSSVSTTISTSLTTISTTFSTTTSRSLSSTSGTITNSTTTGTTLTETTSFTTSATYTSSASPAPAKVMKVSVEISVNDPEQYVEDPAVQQAYKAAFVEISGLNASMVAVDMAHSGGTTTATFRITVPQEQTVADVQEKIKAVTPDTFAEKVRALVDAAVGADTYTEKVVGESASKGSAPGDLDAAHSGCFPSLVFLAIAARLCRLL